MQYRTLGKTGVEVSEVGLGTWQLGGADWGDVSDDDALRILRRSVDRGVNLLDTADVYGMGRSEQLIGRFLRDCGQTVHVATKLGRRMPEGGKWPERITLDMARRATQRSLQNLGIDSIFLQQWHCIPTEFMRDGEVFEHMEALKREGLIRHWGCSVESIEEAMLCLKHPGCDAIQVIFNIFRQKVARELLPACETRRVGVLARVPLASGLLTGKFRPGHRFGDDDHRHYNADGQKFNVGETFAGVPFDQGAEAAQSIRSILQQGSTASMAQNALRWVLDHPAVSTVIPGATKISQAESNAAASDLPPLSQEIHRDLAALYDRRLAGLVRGKY